MSKASILKMALEEIARGVKKVDLGDLTRKPNAAARVQAVTRMAADASKKVASKVDDWGWKGGKPGEITGLSFTKQMADAYAGGNTKNVNALYKKARKQLGIPDEVADSVMVRKMYEFSDMESAGIPRAYTGKIYKKIGDILTHANVASWVSHPKFIRGLDTPGITGMLSEQLKPLTHAQRLTAIDMLPTWPRSLDDLGKTAKEITKMTSDQKETFLSLLPEWTESLDSLYNAAKNI